MYREFYFCRDFFDEVIFGNLEVKDVNSISVVEEGFNFLFINVFWGCIRLYRMFILMGI